MTIAIVLRSLDQTPLLRSHAEIKMSIKNATKHVPTHYSITVGGGIKPLWTTLILDSAHKIKINLNT